MTQEELLRKNMPKIKEAMDKAQEDTTPFTVVDSDGDVTVVGDANKTEVKKNDYVLTFRLPKEMARDKEGRMTPRGLEVDVEYKDIFITPRQDMSVARAMVKLLPYFNKVDEDGNIVQFTKEESDQLIANLSDEIINDMYDLVALVLNVDSRLKDYIIPISVLEALGQIILDYPELQNESDTFFD